MFFHPRLPPALLAVEASEIKYGQTLARQLFADSALEQRFLQVETAAQTSSAGLRVSLNIDPSAQELQALRWELLRHPKTGARLTTTLLYELHAREARYGVVTMCSAMGREFAQESNQHRQGYFTLALTEGLSGDRVGSLG